MFCTTPGLCAPITATISDNTAHLRLSIYVLNTCLQPVAVVYEYHYPSLVILVYWFECELGLCTPPAQSCWDLTQKSMAITSINWRVVVRLAPEVSLASRDDLGGAVTTHSLHLRDQVHHA